MSLIPTPLTPYILWVKIAAVLLVLALAAGTGWKTRGWQCDAALKDAVQQELNDTHKLIGDYKKELVKQETFKDAQRADYQKQRNGLEARNRQLEEEIRNANLNTVTPRAGESLSADEPFNREFLREWNAAISGANAGGAAEAGPGLLGTDTTAARITREDVLQNHRVITNLYADCKVKQGKVIEHDQKYRTPEGVTP